MRTRVHVVPAIADGAIALAADVVLDRLGVSADDEFLVVSNPELIGIAAELLEAANARTPRARLEEFASTRRDGEEPPTAVAAAMRAASAVAIVTRFSLSHTQARLQATRAGARIASLPGISAEIFARTIPVDYTLLERAGRSLSSN